jgi:hypothetical protein
MSRGWYPDRPFGKARILGVRLLVEQNRQRQREFYRSLSLPLVTPPIKKPWHLVRTAASVSHPRFNLATSRLAPLSSSAWNLRHIKDVRTAAFRSVLKATTTFGPVVVSPDDEDDAPFDYLPELQGWLISETGAESGGAVDVEELWAEVVAFAVGIAQHHHSKVFIRAVGKDFRTFLIQVAGTLFAAWLLHR